MARESNANQGIKEVTLSEIYDCIEATYKVSSNESKVPRISASTDDKNVKVTITQAESVSEHAVVQFNYKGIVKTYNVVFVPE